MPAKKLGIIGCASGAGGKAPGYETAPAVYRNLGLIKKLQALGHDVTDFGDILTTEKKTPLIAKLSEEEKSLKNIDTVISVAAALHELVLETLEAKRLPIILGGDHSLSFGSVSAVAEHHRQRQQQSIGLIWVDTHADINTPATSPSKCAFGTPVAYLSGITSGALSSFSSHAPAVAPKNIVYIGLRDVDPGEKEFLRSGPFTVFTMKEVDRYGLAAVVTQAHEVASRNTGGYVVSFDLDVCDPPLVPGTVTPVRGGLTFREAHLIMELFYDFNSLLSFEMMELNPSLDQDNITAELAISLLESVMGKQIC